MCGAGFARFSVGYSNDSENPRRLRDLGEHLAPMEEQGIDVQVLSLMPPGPHNRVPSVVVEMNCRVNDLT